MSNPRKSSVQAVTANDLRSGAVVYLTAAGEWSRHLAEAAVAAGAEALKPLEAIARAAVVERRVTAVYAFDVHLVGDRPHPISVREIIRAANAAA